MSVVCDCANRNRQNFVLFVFFLLYRKRLTSLGTKIMETRGNWKVHQTGLAQYYRAKRVHLTSFFDN